MVERLCRLVTGGEKQFLTVFNPLSKLLCPYVHRSDFIFTKIDYISAGSGHNFF